MEAVPSHHQELIHEITQNHFQQIPISIQKLNSLTNWVYKTELEHGLFVVIKILNNQIPNSFMFRFEKMEGLLKTTNFFGDLVIFENNVYKIEKFIKNIPFTDQTLRDHNNRIFLMRTISNLHKVL